MVTVYCMGKLWTAVVYCIEMCGNVGLYIVFVTLREQSGDVCIVPETGHGTAWSNWEIIAVHVIFSSIITLNQNNMLTCSPDMKFPKLGMGERLCIGEGLIIV